MKTLCRAPGRVLRAAWVPVLLMGGLLSCTSGGERSTGTSSPSRIVQLLAAGQPVFGIYSGDHTAEQGTVMAANHEADFIFYSLESGPFDVPAMEAYMQGMVGASGEQGPHPVALRIPPIRDGAELAAERVGQGIAAGVESIVFPHVESDSHAAAAVRAMGAELWPGNPDGGLVAMLIVEDTVGIARARDIVSTPGVSVVFAGPGDLRRAYNGDMEAVERAIQAVLAACKEFNVPCGITAGVEDIGERLAQGFRVFIVRQPEVLTAGRQASGRVRERATS